MAKNILDNRPNKNILLVVGAMIALTGIALLLVTNAASGSVAIESEQASLVGGVKKCDDYIVFSNSCDGSNDGFPSNHAEAVAAIKASNTREKILKLEHNGYSGSWDLDNRPQRLLPSLALSRSDYVIGTGERNAGTCGGSCARGGGVVHVACSFSHFSYDDPIVSPGNPGSAHLHMYFGNTHANAYSTHDTLQNEGASTCQHGELNRTAYWIPALLDGNDHALTPSYMQVYYERLSGMSASALEAFPPGLNFIIGDSGATSPQPVGGENSGLRFYCGWYEKAKESGGGSRGPYSSSIPHCDRNSYSHIQLDLDAPYCWNGKLDWKASERNVVYAIGNQYNGNCPSSHPRILPFLKYRIHFKTDISPTPTSTWYLASDINPHDGSIKSQPGITVHSDWFGGWHRDTLERLTDDCMRPNDTWCDRQHMGNGDIVAKPVREGDYDDRRFSPEELVKLCPLRNGYDGKRQNVAYCKASGHSNHSQ